MTHEHEPDLSTLTVNYDGGAAYLDVACVDKNCGISGCIGEIMYDDADSVLRIVTNDGGVHFIPAGDIFERYADEVIAKRERSI